MGRKLSCCHCSKRILRYRDDEMFKYLLVLTCIIRCVMHVVISRHAKEKMVDRGINLNEVKNAITSGEKYFQEPNKIVAEYGYFSVVYKKIGSAYFVITVQPRW